MTDDSLQIWKDYYARLRRRRIAEAQILYSRMASDEVTDDTKLVLDFMHFGSVEDEVRNLAKQLSENYVMTFTQGREIGYWNAFGTTRPDGVDGMNAQRCVDWVAFMCDVANSYGCVFTTWTLTDPVRQLSWSNETIDTAPE